jgi:SAM-dependent methyltransferase
MNKDVEAFYDSFSKGFVDDIVVGNERVQQQLEFFSRAIPVDTKSVLVIGCGSGQGAHFIATTIARNARVLGVDISSENLRLARQVFSHPRIEYRQVDVIVDEIDGQWDVIALPDVYEHIPKDSRNILHQRFDRLLSERGRILFTVPSPGKQASLYATGKGLQIVDEVVTLEDLSQVAQSVGAVLSYFNMVSIWETNDYIHAVVERGAEPIRPLDESDKIPIKGWAPRTLWVRGRDFLGNRLGLYRVHQQWRRRQVSRKIAQSV